MKLTKILSLALVAILAFSALVLTSCTEQTAKDDGSYTVGVVQLVQHPALDAATQGFVDTLNAEFGDKITVEVQNAQGAPDTCATITSTFVNKKVDLIMANATPALQAAQNATMSIPILGTSVTEYGVALGIDNFTGLVGSNISGTSDLAPLDKQAQMVIDLVPEAKKVAMIYCSAEANSAYQVKVVTDYLTEKGLECKNFSFSDSNDVQLIAAQAADWADAIYIPTDNTAASCAETIWGAIASKKVPVIAGEEGICKSVGIAALSIDYYDLGVKTGEMAIAILKGESKIEEMPIAYTPEEKLAKKYNPSICAELGIDTAALEAAGYVAIAD